MKPVRIKASRRKGHRQPPNTRPGLFGNPYADALEFRMWLQYGGDSHLEAKRQRILAKLPELKGLNLACYCDLDKPCHADVLLELANGNHPRKWM